MDVLCSERREALAGRQVVFAGFSITPYFRDFLNRLQQQSGCFISVVKPCGKNKHLGAGVKVDEQGAQFTVLELDEIQRPASASFGIAAFPVTPTFNTFPDLPDVLSKIAGDIVVVNVNYHDAFYYDTALRKRVHSLNIKVVFHSIPFQIPSHSEVRNSLQVPARLNLQSLPLPLRSLLRFLMLDRLIILPLRRFFAARLANQTRLVYRAADAFAVYHEGGIELYGSYGVDASRVHVVRNSPNTEALIRASEGTSKSDNGHSLIHVGRLVEWKRVDLLIRALGTLRSNGFPAATLTIVGYGPEEQKLRQLTEDLGLCEAVTFVGGVYEPGELAALFAKASVYVLAGMGGLSINEAMCFRMPIVCCRGDGTEKFLVRDGENGFYFREGDMDDLVRVLEKLLSSAAMRSEFGSRSLQIIQREINTKTHVDNYIRLFSSLLTPA
jgi:glycosyltransferase involved in cell wall biosynthesis